MLFNAFLEEVKIVVIDFGFPPSKIIGFSQVLKNGLQKAKSA